MKKAVVLLLVFLTSFQLSGGYALAAALSPVATANSAHESSKQTISQKHSSLFHYLNQLLNQEEKEEDFNKSLAQAVALPPQLYQFEPVFSVQNKHFLIHYASSIKGKLPSLYLLHNIFRL